MGEGRPPPAECSEVEQPLLIRFKDIPDPCKSLYRSDFVQLHSITKCEMENIIPKLQTKTKEISQKPDTINTAAAEIFTFTDFIRAHLGSPRIVVVHVATSPVIIFSEIYSRP